MRLGQQGRLLDSREVAEGFHPGNKGEFLLDAAVGEADPAAEAALAGGEFEYAGAAGLEVVIDGVAAAVTAVDKEEPSPEHHVVVVMVVSGDDSADVSLLQECEEQPRIIEG